MENQWINPPYCPECGGVADNGHDREEPINWYVCTKCEEKDK